MPVVVGPMRSAVFFAIPFPWNREAQNKGPEDRIESDSISEVSSEGQKQKDQTMLLGISKS